MTYDIANEIELKRRAGYSWDLVFTVPSILTLVSGSKANFTIFKNGETIFTKGYSNITITGQNITITAIPTDTEGKQGNYNWKLDGYISGNKILLGSGNFILE
jgi:hypothetical protein